ncbi:MAG: HEAT repeat domain-containing protein [Myxococcota bacterium]
MSIAALQMVYDELRRLMVAGSDLAANDFRLKKLVPALRKSADKAPVFGKVADGVQSVLTSAPEASAKAMLDLATLVTAILQTQGQTGRKGELEPLETQNVGLTASTTSARVLQPLIDALTSAGSGRLQIITEANERDAFKDLRLVRPAVTAIGDHGEIADYVAEHVLPIYGPAIFGLLEADFSAKGKTADARRLRLMHQLRPQAAAKFVDEALESGSKEVQIAALGCLNGRSDAVDYLLEQSRSRTKAVRDAAYRSLTSIDEPAAVARMIEALESRDVSLVAPRIANHPNAELRQKVEALVDAALTDVLHPPPRPTRRKVTNKKTPAEMTAARVDRLHALLPAALSRARLLVNSASW